MINMIKTALPMCAASLLIATSAIAATDPAPAPAPSTTVAPAIVRAPPEDKVVCKTEVATGSRLGGQKICMKKSDWAAQAADARRQRDFGPPAGIAGAH
jgi:hypothetical protein